MHKILKFFKRKMNNKGFSLVELISAIAIMSIVGVSIAGIMVVSAKTYANGTTEVELQESAQMLANQVNNLVQDGFEATGGSGSLVIKTSTASGDKQYNITLTGSTVNYSEAVLNSDGSVASTSNSEPMAENVTSFECDTTDFEKNGLVKMYIALEKDDANGGEARSFAGNFTATSRNIKTLTTVRAGELTMNYTPEYILEPNQSTTALYASMSDNSGIEWAIGETTIDPETILETLPDGTHKLTIGKNETNEKITIVLSSAAKRSDGVTPKVQKTATVYIRRINTIDTTYKDIRHNTVSKSDVSAGAKYRVDFAIQGYNLEKIPNVPDMGYDSYEDGGVIREGIYRTIDPRDVIIESEICVNGTVIRNNPTQLVSDIEIVQDFRRGYPSYVQFTLRRELQNGEYVKFTCKSKHSLGKIIGGNADGSDLITNITGLAYGDIGSSWILYKSPFPDSGGRITRGGGDRVVGNIDSILAIMRSEAQIPHPERIQSYDVMKTYRFCEVVLDESGNVTSQGMWTNWRGFVFNDVSLKIPNEASLSLECDKSYYFEICFEAYDPNDHTRKIWPTAENARETYVYTEFIPKLSLYFSANYYADGRNVTIFQDAIGGSYETDVINSTFSLNINTSKTVGYALEGTYNEVFSQNGHHINWVIERYDETSGEWTSQMDYQDITYTASDTCKLDNIQINRKGKYRIYFNLKDVPHFYYVPASSTYARTSLASVSYADEATGKGYFYFTTTQNTDYWNSLYIEFEGQIYSAQYYFVCEGELIEKSGLQTWTGYDRPWYERQATACYNNNTIYYADNGIEYEKYTYTFNSSTGKAVLKRNGSETELTRNNYTQKISNSTFRGLLKQLFGWW